MIHRDRASINTAGYLCDKIDSTQLNQINSDKRSIPAELIENARSLLERQDFGISYTDVLQSIIEKPWIFHHQPHAESLALTRQLVALNPQLSAEYQATLASEGPFARGFAFIPLIGQPCRSTLFLEANKEVNSIVDDLRDAGLLQVTLSTQFVSALGGRAGVMNSATCSLWIVAPTELGKAALLYSPSTPTV